MCCVACSSTRTQQQPTLYIVHIYSTKKGKSSHEWECDDYEWDFMFIFIIMWADSAQQSITWLCDKLLISLKWDYFVLCCWVNTHCLLKWTGMCFYALMVLPCQENLKQSSHLCRHWSIYILFYGWNDPETVARQKPRMDLMNWIEFISWKLQSQDETVKGFIIPHMVTIIHIFTFYSPSNNISILPYFLWFILLHYITYMHIIKQDRKTGSDSH